MMMKHLHRDLLHLRESILALGGLVEDALERASTALVQQRADIGRQVIDDDVHIDRRELLIDDECLKILALHQPVASDLRLVTASMKINNDLERIADLAVNIAERAIDLSTRGRLAVGLQFEEMTAACRWMLRTSLNALVQGNASMAREVCARDDEVDDLNRKHFAILIERMRQVPAEVETCLDYLTASLNLERIADLTTNIAKDVVFQVEAVDIRHRKARLTL